MGDRDTIDGLVEEYSKLSWNEAEALSHSLKHTEPSSSFLKDSRGSINGKGGGSNALLLQVSARCFLD